MKKNASCGASRRDEELSEEQFEEQCAQFRALMEKAGKWLSDWLSVNGTVKAFKTEKGDALDGKTEKLVCRALEESAEGTPFEGRVKRLSGRRFPDIVVGGRFGVEVKCTKEDSWECFGNSIFESTRAKGVECIYIAFGRLGGKREEFRLKPYEDCMEEIQLDHGPRYWVNMELDGKNTVFSRMKISYREFSAMPDEEKMQWCGPQIKTRWYEPRELRPLAACGPEEKAAIQAEAFCLFPGLFGKAAQDKYNAYAKWLIEDKLRFTCNARDGFSSGGRTSVGGAAMPAVAGSFLRIAGRFLETLAAMPETMLRKWWNVSDVKSGADRLDQWFSLAAAPMKAAGIDGEALKRALAAAPGA